MKQIYLFGGLALMMGLTACNHDDYNYQASGQSSAINIITNLEDQSTIVSQGTYNFSYKISSDNQVGSVSTSNLIIDNSTYSFETVETPYQNGGYYNLFYFSNPQSSSNNLSDDTFYITPYYYYPKQFMEDTYFNNPYPLQAYYMIAQYTLDNKYKVKTFQPNTLFYGKTTTSYPGANGMEYFTPGSGENEKEMVYLLSIDIKTMKANVIIYNAKFAPPSPTLTQVHLKDLDVDFSNEMVRVTGENIIPLVPEGTTGEMTEYTSFPFNNFELKTTNNSLTKCKITYTVATRFNGMFTGSYVAETKFTD